MPKLFGRYPYMLFAPDNGAGQSGASAPGAAATGQNSGVGSTPKPEGDSNNQSDAGQNAGTNTSSAADPAQTTPPVTTPDQVSMPRASFNSRIADERNAGQREIFRALGIELPADAEDPIAAGQEQLRELVDFAKQQRLAQMSAEERVQEQVRTAENRAKTAEASAATLTSQLETTQSHLRNFVLRTQIMAAAASSNSTDPDEVFHWAMREKKDMVDAILVEGQSLFGEDGTFNPAAISQDATKKVVEECAKVKKHWFKPTHPGTPSNAFAQPPRPNPNLDKKTEAGRTLIRF